METLSTTPGAPDAKLGDMPPLKRNGPKTLLPSTWLGRTLKIEYADPSGKPQSTGGTLLDFCPFGPILNVGGARTCLAWDRLVLIELANG